MPDFTVAYLQRFACTVTADSAKKAEEVFKTFKASNPQYQGADLLYIVPAGTESPQQAVKKLRSVS